MKTLIDAIQDVTARGTDSHARQSVGDPCESHALASVATVGCGHFKPAAV